MGAAAFKVARLAKTHDFVVCRSLFHDLSRAPTRLLENLPSKKVLELL